MAASGSSVKSSLAEIGHQDGHDLLRVERPPGVTVDQLQPAVRKLAGQQGVGIADLPQGAAQGGDLPRGMRPPVLRRGTEIAGPHAAQLLDPIANADGGVVGIVVRGHGWLSKGFW